MRRSWPGFRFLRECMGKINLGNMQRGKSGAPGYVGYCFAQVREYGRSAVALYQRLESRGGRGMLELKGCNTFNIEEKRDFMCGAVFENDCHKHLEPGAL